jgi:hypothetical protein
MPADQFMGEDFIDMVSPQPNVNGRRKISSSQAKVEFSAPTLA